MFWKNEREKNRALLSALLTEGAAVEKGTFFVYNITKYDKTIYN